MPIPSRPANNFLVAKWSDIYGSLDSQEVDALIRMLVKLAQHRRTDNRVDNRQYVVVSDKNRSMFDEVWGMVLSEIETSNPRPEPVNRSNPYFEATAATSGLMRTLRSRLQQFESDIQNRSRNAQSVSASYGGSFGSVAGLRADTTIDEMESSYQMAWENRTPVVDSVEEETYALDHQDFNGTESVVDYSVDEPSASVAMQQAMIASSGVNSVSFRWQPGVRDTSETDSREEPRFMVGDLETFPN